MRSIGNTLFLEASSLSRPSTEPAVSSRSPFTSRHRGTRAPRRQCVIEAAGGGARQDLNDKAYRTGEKLRYKVLEGYSKLDTAVRNGYSEVDRRFNVGDKAGDVANRVREQAKDVDQKYGIRQRIRLFADNVQRKVPAIRKRWKAFSGTTAGSITITLGICYLFASGIAFRILNILLGLSLILPFVLVPISQYYARQAQSRQQGRSKQQQQGRGRAAGQNPFAGFQQQQQQPFSGQARGPGRPRKESSQDGDVIDAEWETVDDR